MNKDKKQENELDTFLENSKNKKSALKKIIQELEKNEKSNPKSK